jgi:hypothetical protein
MIWRYHEKKASHSGRLLGVLADTEADTIDTNADTNVAPKHPRTERDAKYSDLA